MITYILESTIIWLVLFAFYAWFLQGETYFYLIRLYLLGSLAAGCFLPLLHIPLGSPEALPLYTLPLMEWFENAPSRSEQLTPALSGIDWTLAIFLSVYALGTIVMFAKLAQNIQTLFVFYRHGEKYRYPGFLEIGINRDQNPFSFFHFLFIPESLKHSGHYELIRRHELVHIRQWHSLDILIVEGLRIVFWFNPLIRYYKNALVQNHEFLADEFSLRAANRYEYGKLLLSLNNSQPLPNLTNRLTNSIIKNRLTMMYKNRSGHSRLWRFLPALPLLSLLFVLFACEQKEAANQDMTTEQAMQTTPETTAEEVFQVVEQMPRFPGCEELAGTEEEIQKCSNGQMLKYIFDRLKYPEGARKKGIQGTVIAEFVVDANGGVRDARILQDIGEGCGDAVLGLINGMNDMPSKWMPGMQQGKKVSVKYTLPVKFKLDDKE